jgi:hypothetical protein
MNFVQNSVQYFGGFTYANGQHFRGQRGWLDSLGQRYIEYT